MAEKFITVAVFQYPTEAEIIKGRLESEGIQVFMFDIITINTDPLFSNAVGGVKLNVLVHQADKAKTILNSISKYSIDDNGNKIACPKCNGNKIELFKLS